jgi:hypothetical protein
MESKNFEAATEETCISDLLEEEVAGDADNFASNLDGVDGGGRGNWQSSEDAIEQSMQLADRTEDAVAGLLLCSSIVLVAILLVYKSHCDIFSIVEAAGVGEDPFASVSEGDVFNIQDFGFTGLPCVRVFTRAHGKEEADNPEFGRGCLGGVTSPS